MKAAGVVFVILFNTMALNAAEQPSAETNPPAAKSAKYMNERLCRYESRVGSHFRKKICRTRQQWQMQKAEDDAFVRDELNRQDAQRSLPSEVEA